MTAEQKAIIEDHHFRAERITTAEMATPVLLSLWAVWFALFVPGEMSQTYAYLRYFAPDWAWSLIFLTLAVFKSATVLFDHRRARRVGVLLSMSLWSVSALLFALGNPHSHAVPTCLFMIYFNLLTWQRLNKRATAPVAEKEAAAAATATDNNDNAARIA